MAGLCCILGVTEGTVERNILAPMREIFGERLVSRIDGGNQCRLFGQAVYCIGAERAAQTAKLRGASFKYAYGDEVTEWSRDVFEMLKSRLDKPYSVFDGSCNPEGPGHWLKAFLDSGNSVYAQYYTIDDNPYLDAEFVSALKREYEGTAYYNRYILGLWSAPEGLVYPMFKEDVHVVYHMPEMFTRYYVSIDYGIKNATAMLLFGLCGAGWVCMDEYYYSGRESGLVKTDEEYYQELVNVLNRHNVHPERVIVDPSAASFIALIRRKAVYAVKPADNAVLDGIRNVASAFQTGLLKIHKNCARLLDEIAHYVWDGGGESERPLKERDHACDALRYFVRTAKINRGP
jgi:PBSX family phage terminase large subunit